MTPKSQDQIAAELYPTIPTAIVHYDYNDIVEYQREAWLSGLQVGAEFAEWCWLNGWNFDDKDNEWYDCSDNRNDKLYTTAELLEIFLKEKYGK
jgi:hypothetical protein